MNVQLTDAEIRRLRSGASLLHRPEGPSGAAGVLQVVRHLGAVQAQSWLGATLAIRARSRGLTRRDVDTARVGERCVVRGWFLRGTLHLVATDDAGWLLQLLGGSMIAATARRYRELGLDEDLAGRAVDAIDRAVLRSGPLTRREIGAALLAAGLPIDTSGQQVIHLIRRASLAGRLCYGPDRGRDETWVAVRDWLGRPYEPPIDLDVASAELARRYLRGYGPATVGDFATWSGLPMPVARGAFGRLGDGVTEVQIGGAPAAILTSAAEMTSAGEELRLLGEFDPYLLGYRSRSFAVDERFARAIHPGGGMLRQTVIRDGWAVGTWRLSRTRGRHTVTVDPFHADDVLDVTAEAADVDRFLTS